MSMTTVVAGDSCVSVDDVCFYRDGDDVDAKEQDDGETQILILTLLCSMCFKQQDKDDVDVVIDDADGD